MQTITKGLMATAAAGAMALSSVFVLGNAMRLKRFRSAHHVQLEKLA